MPRDCALCFANVNVLQLLKQISTDGQTVTEQNFIDGFYQ